MKIEKTIGVAVIGTGFMGSHYARICAQMAGVRVVALCDLLPERVTPLAAELGAMAYPGSDYNRMLQEEKEIDAVLVCTREDSHLAPALAVLEAGKHMMIEKPLATTIEDAQAIVAAARGRTSLVTMVAYTLRFDPRFIRLKRAIAQNDIGDILHIYARRTTNYMALLRLGFRVELPLWIGVHDIDAMRWITGSEVSHVVAVSSQKGLEDRGIKRSVLSLLTFENGVIAMDENSWGPDYGGAPQQSTACFRVQGTKGFAEVENLHQGVTVETAGGVAYPDTMYMPTSYGRIAGAYADQMAYFIHCVRLGIPSEVNLQDGLKGLMVAEEILRCITTPGAAARAV